VVSGQGDLARAGEVEVVRLEPVDLVRVRAEEPGSGHHLGPDQGRGDHRCEPGRERGVHGRVEQRKLQPGADAGQEVEPGARHLGAPLGVDRPEHLPQLEVVPGRETGAVLGGEVARGALGAQHDVVVLAAGRHAVLDHVRDPVRRLGEHGVG